MGLNRRQITALAARTRANLPGLARAAFRLLKLGNYVVRQSDKDGGFVL